MTMAEIDRRRAELEEARECRKDVDDGGGPSFFACGSIAAAHREEAAAEASVLEALREWWAQDCKEA
jgi:hypothetical protein